MMRGKLFIGFVRCQWIFWWREILWVYASQMQFIRTIWFPLAAFHVIWHRQFCGLAPYHKFGYFAKIIWMRYPLSYKQQCSGLMPFSLFKSVIGNTPDSILCWPFAWQTTAHIIRFSELENLKLRCASVNSILMRSTWNVWIYCDAII